MALRSSSGAPSNRRRPAPPVLLAAFRFRWMVLAALVVVSAPLAYAFSSGICAGCEGGSNAPPGDFATLGCVACHGAAKTFGPLNTTNVRYSVVDAEGNPLNGAYAAGGAYTITITLDEQNNPGAANRAGFNLRAAAGKLSAVEGQSQVSADGMQATHVGPGRTSWSVGWEAPESGAAGFSLFVNDVDGSAAPDEGDQVYWLQFGFGDAHGAVLGAAQEEDVEFGIVLQQYWIGLIGLAGMLFVVVASFVYIKFVNPHNADQKDR